MVTISFGCFIVKNKSKTGLMNLIVVPSSSSLYEYKIILFSMLDNDIICLFMLRTYSFSTKYVNRNINRVM